MAAGDWRSAQHRPRAPAKTQAPADLLTFHRHKQAKGLLEHTMSFADRDGTIWFDGELIPWRDAKVHVLTHTLHYGMGVFEGVRATPPPTTAPLYSV